MHTWERSEGSAKGKSSLSRIISVATLVTSVAALYLALKKPGPVAAPQSAAAVTTNAQSFQAKVSQLEQAQAEGQTGSEVRLTAGEISAAIAQAASPSRDGALSVLPAATNSSSGSNPDPTAAIASGAIDAGAIGEPMINLEGDVVRGQFLAEVGGKKVYVTVAGHLGAKDGYVTFEPTEFKVGDLSIPVSLVNDALQKKMLEQHDRFKLPEFVSDVRVENSELVVKPK